MDTMDPMANARDIPLGKLVVVREDITPPLSWPLGRITTVHPGDDDVIGALREAHRGASDRYVISSLYIKFNAASTMYTPNVSFLDIR